MQIKSYSPRTTKELGAKIARQVLCAPAGREAKVIALAGDLGSGKTTFTQGFVRGLGIRTRVTSPTFILMRKLAISHKLYANCYHVDAYRLRQPREILKLGWREISENPQNIVLVEWADKLGTLLPQRVMRVKFLHGDKPHKRVIKVGRF